MQPDTRYAKSGDVHIAYQVFGEGPLNVVFAPPAFTNVEHWWDEPEVSRWLPSSQLCVQRKHAWW